jgi:geranylgeranyl pyrophosphate synthase
MNKYIPKVGEAFQFINDTSNCWVQCGKVIAETHTEIAYLYESNGEIRTLKKDRRFFPIQTKADDEREQLREIINKSISKKEMINLIQQAGFTIPKKVKRSDIADAIYSSIGDVTDIQSKYAANKVCNLLGDLVEQDKGGAE